jgi:hypothetical protein
MINKENESIVKQTMNYLSELKSINREMSEVIEYSELFYMKLQRKFEIEFRLEL